MFSLNGSGRMEHSIGTQWDQLWETYVRSCKSLELKKSSKPSKFVNKLLFFHEISPWVSKILLWKACNSCVMQSSKFSLLFIIPDICFLIYNWSRNNFSLLKLPLAVTAFVRTLTLINSIRFQSVRAKLFNVSVAKFLWYILYGIKACKHKTLYKLTFKNTEV